MQLGNAERIDINVGDAIDSAVIEAAADHWEREQHQRQRAVTRPGGWETGCTRQVMPLAPRYSFGRNTKGIFSIPETSTGACRTWCLISTVLTQASTCQEELLESYRGELIKKEIGNSIDIGDS